MKFRIIFSTILGCIVCGCLIIATMPLPLSKSLPYQGLILCYIAFQLVLIELGQTIQTQSEVVYDNILQLNWYRWNRVNRKTLLMFMKILQKPMKMRFYGLLNMNRELILKIFKGVYSVVNLYKATTV
ncbi:unnamed protein product [Phyllotreta striolata]|uniref:Uncharacterized protein n=1 Tax=Phyllotreta striolata TaxID=444603 RepID=A0A9N9TSK1_PHYSR|nr:unnamed protein product [Phyllotreta striolata]